MGCGVNTKESIKSKILMLKVDKILVAEQREEYLKQYNQVTGQILFEDSNLQNEGKGKNKKGSESHNAKLSLKAEAKKEGEDEKLLSNNKTEERSNKALQSIHLKRATISS